MSPLPLERLAYQRDRFRDPMLTVLAVLLAFILFVHLPLAARDVFDPPVMNVAIALVIATSVAVVSRRVVAVIAIASAGAVGLAAMLIAPHTMLAAGVANGAALVFLVALSWVVADAVFAPGRVTLHRILGAIVLYLNVGSLFLIAYYLLAILIPHAFSGVPTPFHHAALRASLSYFSFETLTSAGYGDIMPLHPFARSLANVEGIIGQLFPATFLARIVTLELAFRRVPRRARRAGPPDDGRT